MADETVPSIENPEETEPTPANPTDPTPAEDAMGTFQTAPGATLDDAGADANAQADTPSVPTNADAGDPDLSAEVPAPALQPQSGTAATTAATTPAAAPAEPVRTGPDILDFGSKAEAVRGRRKVRTGRVVSTKMQKTVVVAVETRKRHPLYGKFMRQTTRFKAHDETSQCGDGDTVEIMETRPLSKDKNWRVVRIVQKAV